MKRRRDVRDGICLWPACLCAWAIISASLPACAQVSCYTKDEAGGRVAVATTSARDARSQARGSQERWCDFHLHADERSVVEQVLKAYGVDPIVDSSVVSRQIRFDTEGASLQDAAEMLRLATATFFVDLAAKQVLVVLDTKDNRAKYERQFEKQITIPGLSATELNEMKGIAGNIFELTRGVSQDEQGRIVARAPEADLTAMDKAYHELFAGQSEMDLQVDLYEVDFTKENKTGVTTPNTIEAFNVDSEINAIIADNSTLVEEIIASGLATAGDYTAIVEALVAAGAVSGTVFNSPFVLFGGGLTETGVEWNTSSVDMLLNTSDVRSVNKMQLRVLNHESATFRSGQRYPIETGTYTALATTTTGTVTPQVQYQDLGLTLKITPSIKNPDEVALNFELKVSALAGSSLNDLPLLTNRQYSSNVDVHFGKSALIASVISKQDESAINGISGLGATDRDKNVSNAELVIKVTPRLVRYPHPEATSDAWYLPLRR